MQCRKWLSLAVAGATLLMLLGCSTSVAFTRATYSAAAEKKGALSIQVIDARPAENGGTEPNRMGTVRGGYGNPFKVNTESGKTMAEEVKLTVAQALKQSGYSLVDGNAPTVKVIINKFWCDGLMGYRIDVDVTVQVLDAGNSVVLFDKKITESTGFSIIGSYGPMENAFSGIMDKIGEQTADMSKSTQFAEALAR
jgi:uncharacterized lipoprotein YajG